MRKIVIILLSIILTIYVSILFIVKNNKYDKKKINVSMIDYINQYDSKYIVRNDKHLYLFSDKYNLIFDISLDKVCSKLHNYDIIYRQEDFQYINSYYENDNLVVEYYDIHDCKLISKTNMRG